MDIYTSIDTMFQSYQDLSEWLNSSVFDFAVGGGQLNHESLDYGSNTLTTAPSNPDDWVMNALYIYT